MKEENLYASSLTASLPRIKRAARIIERRAKARQNASKRESQPFYATP
jgi:hypothetical protein